MNLSGALGPVEALPGLVAALVFTHDGLVVDQVGSRFAADQLAAELAGLTESARLCFQNLTLGEVRMFSVGLTSHDVTLLLLPGHFLGLVFERGKGMVGLPADVDGALQPLRNALGGRQ